MAQECSPTGNVIIFANYNGGNLTINCDVNIPNMKIGVCTYESAAISITGPFAGNVTGVIYAGYSGTNNPCGTTLTNTTITGVSSSISDILFLPPATFTDPDGYGSMVCAYSCDEGNQGGCNTSEQVVDYFIDAFGGTLRMYKTQYGCWPAAPINVSGGFCCSGTLILPDAYFTSSDQLLCPGQCINFTDESTGGATSWAWTFEGASTTSSSEQNPSGICYLTAGLFPVTLTISGPGGSDTYSYDINVQACGIPGCTYENAMNYDPDATVDNQSCLFNCDSSCPADFNGDAIVGVADLIIFINMYGTTCE